MMTGITLFLSTLLFLGHFPNGALSFTNSSGGRRANPIQKIGGATSTALSGVRSTARRVRDSILSRDRTDEDLKDGIAFFYDRSSKLWEDVWGEHMHHGYYVPEDRTDHVQAQIDLIDEVLKWAGVDDAKPPQKVVDVGCGIGGSSRHIVRKYAGSTAQGITLSPYQANRGNELAKEQGLSDRASFQVSIVYFALLKRFPLIIIISHKFAKCIGGRCTEHALSIKHIRPRLVIGIGRTHAQ